MSRLFARTTGRMLLHSVAQQEFSRFLVIQSADIKDIVVRSHAAAAAALQRFALLLFFLTDVDSRCGMFHIKLMRAARWRGGNEVLAHMFISAPRLMCFFSSSQLTMIGSGRNAASAEISLSVRLCRVYSALTPHGLSLFLNNI